MTDRTTKDTGTTRLSDAEYQAALAELAEFDKAIAESDRLSQMGTLEKAAVLDKLFHDERWIVERNAERIVNAKTPAGGRPVDPTSRSQFSTWVRGRFNRIAPQTTYRLLDAYQITNEFLRHGEITPSQEAQLRPLKKLTKVAYGSGSRIVPIWELACQIAHDEGRSEPTVADVRHAESEWKREHIPAGQARREDRYAKAESARIKAVAAWKRFVELGNQEQINAFLDVIRTDVEHIDETGRP